MKLILRTTILILCLAASRTQADPPVSSPTASLSHTQGLEIGDPVSANAGAYVFNMPLLDLGGPLPLRYELDYNMHGAFWGELDYLGIDGKFQSRNLAQFAERWTVGTQGVEAAVAYLRNGDFPRFDRASAADPWILDAGMPVRYVMKETGETRTNGYIYVMDPIRETVCIFDKTPSVLFNANFATLRIAVQVDRNGNRLAYTYYTTLALRASRVEDGLGRSLDFTYAGMRLTNVADQAGRSITLKPGTQHGLEVLNAIVDAEGRETSFTYADNAGPNRCVTAVTRPLGNVPYRQTVAGTNLNGRSTTRVVSQTDAYGNTTTLTYSTNVNHVTETRPDGQAVVYEHQHNDGAPKALTDPTGKTAAFGQTANEQVNAITDRLGDTTALTYLPASGHLTSLVNASGGTTTWTYVEQEQAITNPVADEAVVLTFYNLARVDYPDGAFETFTHDARGNVLTHTDRAGHTWTNTYNERGQVLTAANPAGGVTATTYNPDATLATVADSDTGVTAFGYDAYKRVNQITWPDGTSVRMAYDRNDRLTEMVDGLSRTNSFAYDANGNLVRATDPAGAETLFEYDLMDRLVKITDRLGQAATRAYDTLNRLAEIADATGVKAGFQYDVRGWRDRVTRAGKTWTTAYDDEGVPASSTTPLGLTATQTTDKLGFVIAAADPLGNATRVERDAMRRVTAVTNAAGQVTTYRYDPSGRLSGVTLPTGERVDYAYNALGELESIADLNTNLWAFAYSPMGRLLSLTDPLSRVTQYGYDTRGRLNLVTYPDTETQTLAYDAAGNVTGRVYSGAAGPNLAFAYDARNRLTAANDLALAYDAEGRVTATENPGTVFGATWDEAGRLKTATYSNGAFAVTYQYDTGADGTGLLTNMTDSLTGTQIAFGYDDDRRLRTVALPNGETITTTWDNADRLARLQSGDHVDVTLAVDPAGQIAVAELIAPLTPSSFSPQTSSFSFDAASQIATAGYAHDACGRLTNAPGRALAWDGASRLIGIDAVTLAYNGLGQVQTRTEGAATTRFYYNHALGGAPIVAEKDEAGGAILRYYVWIPGGRLLYLIDAADGNKVYFYHFDPVGSTLALTDANGAVTDAWAYDPYGRILARSGANPQPFTFVGAWGVRQEGASGVLYQMRTRYYDAATARFLSPEPIWPQLDDPKALNPYQYAGGDPIRFADPTGWGYFNTIHLFDPEFNVWDDEQNSGAAIPPVSVGRSERQKQQYRGDFNINRGLSPDEMRMGIPDMGPDYEVHRVPGIQDLQEAVAAFEDEVEMIRPDQHAMVLDLLAAQRKRDRLIGRREFLGKVGNAFEIKRIDFEIRVVEGEINLLIGLMSNLIKRGHFIW